MRKNDKGLTLVEILLAVVVFSLVASAVYRVFSVAVKTGDRLDHRLKMDLEILSTVHTLEKDLNNAVLYDTSGGIISLRADAKGMTMIVDAESGLAEVHYGLDDHGGLSRSEQRMDTHGLN